MVSGSLSLASPVAENSLIMLNTEHNEILSLQNGME